MEHDDRESARETDREIDRTTIIQSDGDRGGSSGAIVALVALLVIGVLLFLLFGRGLTGGGDEGDVNVNVAAPEISVPDVELPDVNVTLPESVEAEGNSAE